MFSKPRLQLFTQKRRANVGMEIAMDQNKLQVCFVAPLPPPYGGIANWMAMLDRYLRGQTAIEYTIINSAPKKRVTEGRGILERVVGGGINMLKIRRRLKKEIASHQIDCIHITTSGHLALIRDYILLRLAQRMGIHTIYHIRFGRIPTIMKTNNWERKLLMENVRCCGKVVAIDGYTFRALQGTVFCDKILQVPLFINKKELPEPSANKDKVICFVGWVVPEKGVEELLEAWQSLMLTAGGWRLCFVGPYKEDYRNKLISKFGKANKAEIEKVEFCGEQVHEKTLEVMNRSRIFVLPSHSEGFPNALVEAMALEMTVVATRVGAIPEMLQEGACGYLVPKQDVSMLGQALKQAIEQEEGAIWEDGRTYARRARERVLQEYEIEKVLERYKEIWRNI